MILTHRMTASQPDHEISRLVTVCRCSVTTRWLFVSKQLGLQRVAQLWYRRVMFDSIGGSPHLAMAARLRCVRKSMTLSLRLGVRGGRYASDVTDNLVELEFARGASIRESLEPVPAVRSSVNS